jgi:hypothetical protein
MESINQPGELLQTTVIAKGTDRVELGGIFLGYYYYDFDYADIADHNVDTSEFTTNSE